MSEELIQRNLVEAPEKMGDWNFYNIGVMQSVLFLSKLRVILLPSSRNISFPVRGLIQNVFFPSVTIYTLASRARAVPNSCAMADTICFCVLNCAGVL